MKSKGIWKEIKYWGQVLLLIPYGLSYLFPRDKKIWVFGSTFGYRFADNPKYFYLYINQYQSEQIRAIWITKNRDILHQIRENNLEGYYLYSLPGIWYCLRAKLFLYDNYTKDISYSLSGGAIKVNLWHGIPLKKIQKDNIHDYVRNPRNAKENVRSIPRRITDEKPFHYVLGTSEYLKPIFASAFQTRKVLVNGYPRNDVLTSDRIKQVLMSSERKTIEEIEHVKKANRIVVYMPTFRESEEEFFQVMNMERFQAFLKKNRIVFFIKLHLKSKLRDRFMEIESNNIHIIHPDADPYTFLLLADILVTDYSSVSFDYMLTNKPIIYFSYDLESYLSSAREMYFEFDEMTPGRKVCTQDELETALLEGNIDEYERKRVLSKIYDDTDSFASEELYFKLSEMV